MALYEIQIRSLDIFGYSMISDVIQYAGKGAILKEDTLPSMTFPYLCVMTHETEEEPIPTPTARVFNMSDKGREVYIKKIEIVKVENDGGGFSMEVDSVFATDDSGKPFTKEALDAMQWSDFKAVCKAAGVGGRDRVQMTKQYLANSESLSE